MGLLFLTWLMAVFFRDSTRFVYIWCTPFGILLMVSLNGSLLLWFSTS